MAKAEDQEFDKLGRPTKKTPELVTKLVAAFHNGYNITEACLYVRIARKTYYAWLEEDEDFSNEMERAQNDLVMRAKKKLAVAIDNNDKPTIRWYLERKNREEFALRHEVTGKDGKDLFDRYDEHLLDAVIADAIELQQKYNRTGRVNPQSPADSPSE